MSAWLLLAIFVGFYVLLVIFAVGFYLGERHQARRQLRSRGRAIVHISDRWQR